MTEYLSAPKKYGNPLKGSIAEILGKYYPFDAFAFSRSASSPGQEERENAKKSGGMARFPPLDSSRLLLYDVATLASETTHLYMHI